MEIAVIDTGLYGHQRTAAYLLWQGGDVSLFDTGARSSVPAILAQMKDHGVVPSDVQQIILSHVHLDHAGGAGALMEVCPNASLVVHPRGARHMIDPSKLEASAREVYGDDEFERAYGGLIPVPEELVVIADEGFELGPLKFFDAPGHARHHFIVHDQDSGTVLAGDAFGLHYPERGEISLPTTSPTQFEPEAAVATYQRILDLKPSKVGIGHFGFVTDLEDHATKLQGMLSMHVSIAQAGGEVAIIEQRLANLVPPEAREALSLDLHMNALGLAHWVSKAPR